MQTPRFIREGNLDKYAVVFSNYTTCIPVQQHLSFDKAGNFLSIQVALQEASVEIGNAARLIIELFLII